MKKIIALVSIVLLAVACKKATPTPNNPIPTNVDGERITMVTCKAFNGEVLDTFKFVYENNKHTQNYSSEYDIPTSSSLGGVNKWIVKILIKNDSILFEGKHTFNNEAPEKGINYAVLNNNGTINKLGTIGEKEITLFEYSNNYLSKVNHLGSNVIVLNWKDGNLSSIGNSTFEYYLDKENNIESVLEYCLFHFGDSNMLRGYDNGLYTKNLIKRETYTNEDKSVDTYLYTYKFDTYGRVIERTIQDEKDGSVLYVYKYTWSK